MNIDDMNDISSNLSVYEDDDCNSLVVSNHVEGIEKKSTKHIVNLFNLNESGSKRMTIVRNPLEMEGQ
jgi:hypothetical protein